MAALLIVIGLIFGIIFSLAAEGSKKQKSGKDDRHV